MQGGLAASAVGGGDATRTSEGLVSTSPSAALRIAFIYRGDPRHRTANRLSMLKNVAAAKRLGHEVALVVPREGMKAADAERALSQALEDFDIAESFPLIRVPRATVAGRGRRGFDFLAAAWARARGFDLVWSREFHAADFASAFVATISSSVSSVTTDTRRHLPDFTRRSKRVRDFRASARRAGTFWAAARRCGRAPTDRPRRARALA